MLLRVAARRGAPMMAVGNVRNRNLIEKRLRIPVNVEIASEFRYKDPIIDEKTLTNLVIIKKKELLLQINNYHEYQIDV